MNQSAKNQFISTFIFILNLKCQIAIFLVCNQKFLILLYFSLKLPADILPFNCSFTPEEA